MKRNRSTVSAFLAGLSIGVLGTMLLLTIGATAQTKIIEAHYEAALHTSFAAYDSLYELYRAQRTEGEK